MIFDIAATKNAVLDPEVDHLIEGLPLAIEREYTFTAPGDYRSYPRIDPVQRIPASEKHIGRILRYLRQVRPRLNTVISLLKEERGRGLDVGIGFGLIEVALTDYFGVQIEGSELPFNINSYCAIPLNRGIRVTPWDLGSVPPFRRGTFNFLVLMEVLEHLKLPPGRTISRIASLIAPGGRLILTTPNIARQANIEALQYGRNIVEAYREDLPDNLDVTDYVSHIREYTISEVVEHVENAGLRIEQVLTCNQWAPHDRLLEPLRNDITIVDARKGQGSN